MSTQDLSATNERIASAGQADPGPSDTAIRAIGEEILNRVDLAHPPTLFDSKGFYGRLMEWAMGDPAFKTELFRFVDVLPVLESPEELLSHLSDYLNPSKLKLPRSLVSILKASRLAPGVASKAIRAQVSGMARLFMLSNDDQEILKALRALHSRGMGFTVDVLGETVVSEPESEEYVARYLHLLTLLGQEFGTRKSPGNGSLPALDSFPGTQSPSSASLHSQALAGTRLGVPAASSDVNLSLKLSALCPQINPADPDFALSAIKERIRPILRKAKEIGAFINFDMEHYALKDLTLCAFKEIFAQPEFSAYPAAGIALQAYLTETESDLMDLMDWARSHQRSITVRLVKGAYWDYEMTIARQRGWPQPVFTRKAESDANFEKLSQLLLENIDAVGIAFGTHNVRSIAHALACADHLGIGRDQFEFQMLHGMAEALGVAMTRMRLRVREYCPLGELIPGMAYLVRRLLENTSNESFLANQFKIRAPRAELLANPDLAPPRRPRSLPNGSVGSEPFRNEPPVNLTQKAERDKIRQALKSVRGALGKERALVINNQAVKPAKWQPSFNPADQREIIGYSAVASIAQAEAGLEAARTAQKSWARVSLQERAAFLRRCANLMKRDRAKLAALEILEAGKNWAEADADVVEAIDFCNFYASGIGQQNGIRRTQSVAGEDNFQHWIPRGIGAIIAPWNFPLAILTGMTMAAIGCGNAVVIKPSDQTPIIAAAFLELLIEAGMPPGVANLITGPGHEIGAYLVEHPAVDFIAFTGSMEVGRRIWEAAARTAKGQANLKKVVCEMGGKNALIIDSDADLDEAIAIALSSAFGYQGQKCSALSRLILLPANADRFLERLFAAAASLRVGPAEEPGTMIGPVISRAAQQRLLQMIETAKKEAHLAWIGSVPADPNACYVPPAIFTDVTPKCRIFQEEIFGPLLSVSIAGNFDDALELANDCRFALTGGICSRSPSRIERAKAEMVCGNLYINRPITGAIVGRQPFGGYKMSGAGTKAGGLEYLQNFQIPRVITENLIRRGFAPPPL